MSYKYITTGTTTTVSPRPVYSALIQVNAALTGTITVQDGSNTIAVITNPTVGLQFRYWGLQTSLVVVTSTTCDITVNFQSNTRPN